MDLTGAHEDDDEVRAPYDEREAAREALGKARRAHARAVRVGAAYPKEDLAVLQVAGDAREVGVRYGAPRDCATRPISGSVARATVAPRPSTTPWREPANVDPIVDRLDRAERLRRLEALDARRAHADAHDVAKEGTHPELLRAALTAEAPPWPTKSWQPLLPEAVAEEIREWIMARRAPETVADVRAAWRLAQNRLRPRPGQNRRSASASAARRSPEISMRPRRDVMSYRPRDDREIVSWLRRTRTALDPGRRHGRYVHDVDATPLLACLRARCCARCAQPLVEHAAYQAPLALCPTCGIAAAATPCGSAGTRDEAAALQR